MAIDPRTCSKCLEMKTVSDFYRDAQMRDGIASRCKVCKAAEAREWRRRPEVKSLRAATDRRYRTRHTEVVSERKRKWRMANGERILETSRVWVERNRERVRLSVRLRNARRRANGGTHSKSAIDTLMLTQCGMCVICRKRLDAYARRAISGKRINTP